MRVVLLIISILLLACALVLLILYFVIKIDSFWFSIPLACSAIINLILGSYNLYLKRKKIKKNKKE